jgi:hypothetical protein
LARANSAAPDRRERLGLRFAHRHLGAPAVAAQPELDHALAGASADHDLHREAEQLEVFELRVRAQVAVVDRGVDAQT